MSVENRSTVHPIQDNSLLSPPKVPPPARDSATPPPPATTTMTRSEEQTTSGWTKLFHENGTPVWSNNATGEITWSDPEQPNPSLRQVMSATHAATHLHHAGTPYHFYHCIDQCAAGVVICSCPVCVAGGLYIDAQWTSKLKDMVRSIYDQRQRHPSVNCYDALHRHLTAFEERICFPCHVLYHVLTSWF